MARNDQAIPVPSVTVKAAPMEVCAMLREKLEEITRRADAKQRVFTP
jgi:hypothetical protein